MTPSQAVQADAERCARCGRAAAGMCGRHRGLFLDACREEEREAREDDLPAPDWAEPSVLRPMGGWSRQPSTAEFDEELVVNRPFIIMTGAPFRIDPGGLPFVCRSCGAGWAARRPNFVPWNGACGCEAAWEGEAGAAVRAAIALLNPDNRPDDEVTQQCVAVALSREAP